MNQLIPPYNGAAEQALLGTILVNNSVFDDIAHLVNESDFYYQANREIFKFIEKDLRKGKAVDVNTLAPHQELDFAYLIEIARQSSSPKNAVVYAQTIKDKAIQRELIQTCHSIVECAYQPQESVIELLSDAEKSLSQVSGKIKVNTKDNSATAALKETFDDLRKRVESNNSLMGISTGIDCIDRKINGLKKSTLIVLAARPGMGKTSLALNMLENEAMNGGFPLLFSVEMPRVQIMQKIIASNANVLLQNLLKPKLLEDRDWTAITDAMARLKKTNLEIIDNGSITTDLIRYETRQYVKKHGKVSLVVVDYIQLISGKNPENRTQEISQISRDLKALAKEFECPVLALSQLSRKCEERRDKRPLNSDLRESGQIEQDAEEIIFIYRDEMYEEESPNEGLAEIIISKSRMGVVGTVYTEFNGAISKFLETNRRPVKKQNKTFKERFTA
uniref:replicative DNA helicase n=1 Tax=Ningiella ruwaisensis TaxID=2364274 RepID=UPI00109FBFE0|nr:replicative DNA helicase [Ningiella ruwaisensis]